MMSSAVQKRFLTTLELTGVREVSGFTGAMYGEVVRVVSPALFGVSSRAPLPWKYIHVSSKNSWDGVSGLKCTNSRTVGVTLFCLLHHFVKYLSRAKHM